MTGGLSLVEIGVKRIFPLAGDNLIHEYYRFLNSYLVVKNRMQKCYCEFTIPQGVLLQDAAGSVNVNQSTKKMKLGVYPNTLALDFLSEEENDGGVKGIVRDLLLGNFTIYDCKEIKTAATHNEHLSEEL